MLTTISLFLETNYPNFRLSHTHLNVPLTATTSYFDIYSVITLPIPTNDTSFNTTQIMGHSPFFGFSRDGSYYAEIDPNFYMGCKGNEIKQCAHSISMKQKSIPSCTSALFYDNPRDIMKYCNINYKTGRLFEGTHSLRESYFLASSSDPSWSLECANRPARLIRGCVICIIQIPCGCRLLATTFELPARLTGCMPNTTAVTYLHPINSAVLHTLFPSPVLHRINGVESSPTGHEVILPNIAGLTGVPPPPGFITQKQGSNVGRSTYAPDASIQSLHAEGILDTPLRE
jgi:hypothetical protein